MRLIKTFENYKSIYVSPDKMDDIFVHLYDMGFNLLESTPITTELICKKCNGERVIKCKKCDGKGEVVCKKCDSHGSVECRKCNGEGQIKCCYDKFKDAFQKNLIS